MQSPYQRKLNEINKNNQQREMTKSMMEDSLRFHPEGYMQSLNGSMSKSVQEKQQQNKQKIEDIEYTSNLTQSQLNNLIAFTNKHLQKLCDAVLLLQKDVEILKRERYENMCECEANNMCQCDCGDCEEGCEEEECCEHECGCCHHE
ncbi:Hypothetical_protein [Hexamita inflata]|uniref:Hypothetical_protein n=1 Tax=Hexamita inflata TaxID=28002 RepID=A0AA86VSC3_9EUKA|nr:Hypothetical protein HINF_LOCUS63363 [Hexamita inflata]